MKYIRGLFDGQNKTAIFISILLHLIILISFMFVELRDFLSGPSEYSTITFREIPVITNTKAFRKEQPNNKKTIPVSKNENIADTDTIELQKPGLTADTAAIKIDSSKINFVEADSSDNYLRFAQTLLDTFLVRNPEYAKFILQEQAKGIAKRKFSRQILVQKLNDELHKYLREKYPEGSDHAINKYTGPGLQIPIGDVINLVKKIFD